jgi:N-acetylglutamate synthase-like GNAT family acetyltransferase
MKIVIIKNKTIIAQATLVKVKCNGHYEIEYMSVTKEFRGNGFATKLLNKIKNRIKTPIVALIEPHPDSSMNYTQEKEWLERHGFKEVKKYWFGDCYKKVMLYN